MQLTCFSEQSERMRAEIKLPFCSFLSAENMFVQKSDLSLTAAIKCSDRLRRFRNHVIFPVEAALQYSYTGCLKMGNNAKDRRIRGVKYLKKHTWNVCVRACVSVCVGVWVCKMNTAVSFDPSSAPVLPCCG